MKILPPTPENIRIVAEALRQGDVVGMPTETVYGLAGVAFNPSALARIFETKERPTFDPLIIHVAPAMGARTITDLARLKLVDRSALQKPAQELADRLLGQLWPGPFTLVLPKLPDVPDLATSGLPTVALRMPKHPVAQALIEAAGAPLAAPSANRFGRISPTSAQDVQDEIGDRISYCLDGGRCEVGLESTVVSLDSFGRLTLLRPGGTPQSKIESIAGTPLLVAALPSAGAQVAPGMLESHYAPRKPMKLLSAPLSTLSDEQLKAEIRSGVGILLLSGESRAAAERISRVCGVRATVRTLSETGDLAEAARNLFAEMRAMDAMDVNVILAEPSTVQHGLGHAIGDRLRRASAKRLDG